MSLTPADVRAMAFATTRMRAGYDVDEVDAFLDLVEADIASRESELLAARGESAVLRNQCELLEARLREMERARQSTPPPAAAPSHQQLPQVLPGNENLTVEIVRPRAAQQGNDALVETARRQARRIRQEVRDLLEVQLAQLRESDAMQS